MASPQALGRRAVVRWLAACAGASAWPSVQAAPDASERLLPTSSDLRASLHDALARGEPLIVLATLQGCVFCKMARENYLVPELAAGRAVTQIHFLSRDPVRDWQGVMTTHGELVKQLQLTTAPTLLFYGADAKEVAPRLEGGSASDFYGAYLQDRITQAKAQIRN